MNFPLSTVDNALIARLPESDRAHLLSCAEEVRLALAQVLWHPGESLEYVYFPSQGFVCVIATDPSPSGLEIGMVGREGMLGMKAVLVSNRASFRAVVQAEGRAWRMTKDVLQQHLDRHPATKQLLDRYAAFRLNQFAMLAHCLCHHEVKARLARWLLMGQDRTGSNHFRVTQETLGSMLGVRRVSVTAAATALQQCSVIAYHRGNLQILNRGALEHTACSCYHNDIERYKALHCDTHLE